VFGFGSLDMMSGKYGNRALSKLMADLGKQTTQVLAPVPEQWPGGFADFAVDAMRELDAQEFDGKNLEKDEKNDTLKKFLNRLLGCTCEVQTGLFAFLAGHMRQMEEVDRKEGMLDEGLISLNRSGKWGRLRKIEEIKTESLSHPKLNLQLRRLKLDRGLSWEAAQNLLALSGEDEHGVQGFYVQRFEKERSPPEPVLILRRQVLDSVAALYTIYYPHIAASNRLDGNLCTLARIRGHRLLTHKVQTDEAADAWRVQYEQSAVSCMHKRRGFKCSEGSLCQIGIRCIEQTMLTGPILAHWDAIDAIPNLRPSLVRATTDEGNSLVGIMIDEYSIELLRNELNRRHFEILEARAAYRQAAKNLIKKKKWDPLAVAISSSSSSESGDEDKAGESSDSDRAVTDLVAPPRWAQPASVSATSSDIENTIAKRLRVHSPDKQADPTNADIIPWSLTSSRDSRLAELRARIRSRSEALDVSDQILIVEDASQSAVPPQEECSRFAASQPVNSGPADATAVEKEQRKTDVLDFSSTLNAVGGDEAQPIPSRQEVFTQPAPPQPEAPRIADPWARENSRLAELQARIREKQRREAPPSDSSISARVGVSDDAADTTGQPPSEAGRSKAARLDFVQAPPKYHSENWFRMRR